MIVLNTRNKRPRVDPWSVSIVSKTILNLWASDPRYMGTSNYTAHAEGDDAKDCVDRFKLSAVPCGIGVKTLLCVI